MNDLKQKEVFWSVSTALNVLNEGVRQAGLTYDTLELIRFGTAATYLIQPANIIVRVTRPGAGADLLKKELQIISWLGATGFSVLPVADNLPPVYVRDCSVSFWKYIPPKSGSLSEITPAEFGRTLREFHILASSPPETVGSFVFDKFNPFGKIDEFLALTKADKHIAYKDIKLLIEWRDFLANKWSEEISTPGYSALGSGLIHGDAHIGNLYKSEAGLYLLDFDFSCIGPREWDLIPAAIEVRRFEQPKENYYEFCAAYGFDVATWPGFETLALMRELMVTCWRLNMETSASVHQESRNRLKYWRQDPSPPMWKPF